MTDKYCVYKIDEDGCVGEEVTDFVVIRLQDFFAASALWTYANEIRTTCDIIRTHEMSGWEKDLERLEDIADYFAAMAGRADEVAKKLPD